MRTKVFIPVSILILLFISTSIITAQEKDPLQTKSYNKEKWVDTDGDGIGDNYQWKTFRLRIQNKAGTSLENQNKVQSQDGSCYRYLYQHRNFFGKGSKQYRYSNGNESLCDGNLYQWKKGKQNGN
ncbi:MAG: hypothetical protein JXA68_02595 [Ignavibacteriales bacterium]|nr:hypothetical protein [Ignavibacteriales bacterium]